MARKVFDFDEAENEPTYRERLREKWAEDSFDFDGNSSFKITESENHNESENLPDIKFSHEISDKIDAVVTIDKEYQDAVKAAKRAEFNAQKAKSAADDAAGLSAGFGKKKKAIIALQNAQKEQAEGLESVTVANKKTNELMQKLIEATRALFALGTNSIAANRSVYRQLQLKMKNASEQELSDFARKEIGDVIKQLNDQQDLFEKQKELKNLIHEQDEKSSVLKAETTKQIEELKEQIKKLESTIAKMNEKMNQNKDEKNQNVKSDENKSQPEEKSSDSKKKGFLNKFF